MDIDLLAYHVTVVVMAWSGIFFLTVMILMIFNRNRQPRPMLDWMFIFEKYSLAQVVAWFILRVLDWTGPNPYVRLYIFTCLGAAETLVLWYIYQERFGRGYTVRRVARAVLDVYKKLPHRR